ncbi:MAG TPA: hypothetical protein PLB91_03145 [Spirochaetales bacterium]|nr:hypothetical protein [Spirochaetales bacterium]HRY56224.1 hypothetical protein [Spirochaetia bacterium]HRZ66043.1 hypothetical protein [Spirochaetia bacterium]
MKRVEIVASELVQAEILAALEKAVPGIEYTLIPEAHGSGKRTRKEGTSIWPELNFVLFAYLDDEEAAAALGALSLVRERFPGEGISAFCLG